MTVWQVADKRKQRLTNATKRRIKRIYQDAFVDALVSVNAMSGTRALEYYKIRQVEKQLLNASDEIYTLLQKEIKMSVKDAAKIPAKAIDDMMKQAGFNLKGAFSYVPDDIVEKLASGSIYKKEWTLDSTLWKMNQATQRNIQDIVAKGLVNGVPIEDISNELEKYVLPYSKKAWKKPELVYDPAKKKYVEYAGRAIFRANVDYNAQRLARTMIQHSYQMSIVETQRENPWGHGIMWHSSNSGRVCAICAERDGEIYAPEELPFDHPNGMCYFTVVQDNLNDIASDLSDWVDGNGSDAVNEYMLEAYGL